MKERARKVPKSCARVVHFQTGLDIKRTNVCVARMQGSTIGHRCWLLTLAKHGQGVYYFQLSTETKHLW